MESTSVKRGRAAPSLFQLLPQRLTAHTTLTKFLIVGTLGYLVYQSVLFATYDLPFFPLLPDKDVNANLLLFEHGDIRLLIGTLVAMEFGIAAGFTGHHLWTFRDRGPRKPLPLRFAQFHANSLISALGILTVTVNMLTVQAGFYHFMAVPIGVALAGAWNWTWDTQFIWVRAKRPDAPS